MTAPAWTERTIGRCIARQVLASKCVVLVPNCTWTGHECDVLAVTADLRLIDVEVKISRADLKADADKQKWWQGRGWHYRGTPGVRLSHPPKVWKHYYAMPETVWSADLAASLGSPDSGVLLLKWRHNAPYITCERRAKPSRTAERLSAADAVDIARLANLRMWDAYREMEDANRHLPPPGA